MNLVRKFFSPLLTSRVLSVIQTTSCTESSTIHPRGALFPCLPGAAGSFLEIRLNTHSSPFSQLTTEGRQFSVFFTERWAFRSVVNNGQHHRRRHARHPALTFGDVKTRSGWVLIFEPSLPELFRTPLYFELDSGCGKAAGNFFQQKCSSLREVFFLLLPRRRDSRLSARRRGGERVAHGGRGRVKNISQRKGVRFFLL